MTERLLHAFKSVQDRYLRDPAFADAKAVDAHVRWLREERERIAGELWDEAAADLPDGLYGAEAVRLAMDVHGRAEDRVIEREIVGKLPPRLVHEMRSSWAYLEAEVTDPLDPAKVDSGPLSTLHRYERAAAAHVDAPERVGNPWDYQGADPIEDVALAQKVVWTDVDQKEALEKAIDTYGVEPGQWMEVEWPPVAHLWDPGNVYTTEFEPCAGHVEEESDDCAVRDASVHEVVEQMAQWKWTTTLRINQIGFDAMGSECDEEVHCDNAFEVAIIDQDPRELMIGPPGEGERW
jgi:hypothetical protein